MTNSKTNATNSTNSKATSTGPAREPVRRVLCWPAEQRPRDAMLGREWIVTNGLGGYASGSVLGVATRRFHGLLVASLPSPLGRTMMWNHLSERLRLPGGRVVNLGAEETKEGVVDPHGSSSLLEFRLEDGLPVWTYEGEGFLLEKRLVLVHEQNTVHLRYRLLSASGPLRLNLRPALSFRPHEGEVAGSEGMPKTVTGYGDRRYEFRSARQDLPPLRMRFVADRAALALEGSEIGNLRYRIEERRGYDHLGDLWSPGYFRADLAPGRDAFLTASTEDWRAIGALEPDEAFAAEHDRRARLVACAVPAAREGLPTELVLAADQFLVTPQNRVEDVARARASGDEVRTVIAGYHWFTDWGRDTMISLEGLALATGRHAEAGCILRTFAHYVKDGLLPNMFPEGQNDGLYHTADATLWFFHAIARYVAWTGDRALLERLLPLLQSIVTHHVRGTRFGIGVDPADGLLRQGAEGYQLTWMDAKVEGWVVTPRRGKAVEINALWYNALVLLAGWTRELTGDRDAAALDEHAARARASFNRRFWCAERGHLFDVVDGEAGDDPALRPNQIFAISLDHPVLDEDKWEPVLRAVEAELLTPVGLRSLARRHPDYKPRYDGDLRARDAAYHQGTVWSWLIGPYVDAHLRVRPGDARGVREALAGFVPHLSEACVGTVSEVFDAEPPFTPGGCASQAWSVAELLRVWLKAGSPNPRGR